jgi:hypothetical protein
MSEREQELQDALDDAVDVAIWLTGVADLTDVEAWPDMREKLIAAMAVARPDGVITDGDEIVGVVVR